MEKQDVIKKAYQDEGVDVEKYSKRIDNVTGWMDFGYCVNGFSDVKEELESINVNVDNGHYYNLDPYGEGIGMWRPKSLAGIEDNNGWIKIESEDDLPKEEGQYFVFSKVDWNPHYRIDIFTGRLSNAIHHVTGKPIFTHYQPIIKPSKPLY